MMHQPTTITMKQSNQLSHSTMAGFTLIEMLVVVLMLGIMAAIGTPSYIAWVNNQRVSTARSQIAGTLRKAQSQARATKINREVRFDNNGGNPRIAIIPAINNTTGRPQRVNIPNTNWLYLNKDGKRGLTMRVDPVSPYQNNVGFTDSRDLGGIVFDPYGAIATNNTNRPNANTADERVFAVQVGFGNEVNQHKGCILVRTLLGSFREEKGSKCPL